MCHGQASWQLSETFTDETQSNSFFSLLLLFSSAGLASGGTGAASIDMQMDVKGHFYINLWIMWGWKWNMRLISTVITRAILIEATGLNGAFFCGEAPFYMRIESLNLGHLNIRVCVITVLIPWSIYIRISMRLPLFVISVEGRSVFLTRTSPTQAPKQYCS